MTPDSLRKSSLVTFLALMVLVIVPFIRMISPYAMAMLMATILAVLCQPAYDRLIRRGWGPKRAATAITVGLVLIVLIPLSLFTANLINQTLLLVDKLSTMETLSLEGLMEQVMRWLPFREYLPNPQTLQQKAIEWSALILQKASGPVIGFTTQVPELLMQIILALFATFFFLIDGQDLWNWLTEKLPLSAAVRTVLITSFRNTAAAVIVATIAAAGVQGLAMMLAYAALSVPGAFLAGGATFIFAWVPMLGSAPVWIVGTIYLYMNDFTGKAIVMVIIGILTGIIDNIVRPMVLRGRDEMHPMVSVIAIFGGIALWGLLGVFIGPILTAMVIAILNTWPTVAAEYGIALGEKVPRQLNLERSSGSAEEGPDGVLPSLDDLPPPKEQ